MNVSVYSNCPASQVVIVCEKLWGSNILVFMSQPLQISLAPGSDKFAIDISQQIS